MKNTVGTLSLISYLVPLLASSHIIFSLTITNASQAHVIIVTVTERGIVHSHPGTAFPEHGMHDDAHSKSALGCHLRTELDLLK